MRRTLLALTLAATAALALPARATQPVGAAEFNVQSPVALRSLTPANFNELLLPAARQAGPIVFYDFTESFTPLFTQHVIPRFERQTGLRVQYRQVNGEQAVQQLIAARRANQPAPVDAFFIPNGQVRLAVESGIIANLPLHTMLPAAPDLDEGPATLARGFRHGGVVVPFHRNQTAIGFDTRFVQPAQAPASLDALLAYARANRGRVAITNPSRGGSGQGFLESAIIHMVAPECRTRLFDPDVDQPTADAWAAGPCLAPVMEYFRQLRPLVEFTNGNTDTLTLMANGAVHVGTVWEDQTYDFIGRGLLPPTVRTRLLTEGQVGDGDGVMIASGTRNLAGALVFVNFLLSDEIQLLKLELNGSRSARTRLDIERGLRAENVARLIPQDQYAALARARITGTLSTAATRRFVTEILQQR
jgi:putative spermidine/putrescine transport system substrate-binding protein